MATKQKSILKKRTVYEDQDDDTVSKPEDSANNISSTVGNGKQSELMSPSNLLQPPKTSEDSPSSSEGEEESDDEKPDGPLEGKNAQYRTRRKTPFPGGKKEKKKQHGGKDTNVSMSTDGDCESPRKKLRFCCMPFKV